MPVKQATLLDPPETTAPSSLKASFRAVKLKHNEAEYESARKIYEHLETRDKWTKCEKLDECSVHAYFARHTETGEVRVFSSKCRLRWCPICAKSKQYYVTQNVQQWVKAASHPKFMTLTLRHSEKPLQEQVQNLYDAFRKLRKLRAFKSIVNGGIWFFQIHVGKADGLWHPHLHCVIDGKYLPQGELKEMWRQCTYGSYICDIRQVKDEKAVSEYVARYAARPSLLSTLDFNHAVELVVALHGRRLCGSWGTAAKVRLGQPKCDDVDSWHSVGNYNFVVNLQETDERARAILFAWKMNKPLADNICIDQVERDLFMNIMTKKRPPPDAYLPGFYD